MNRETIIVFVLTLAFAGVAVALIFMGPNHPRNVPEPPRGIPRERGDSATTESTRYIALGEAPIFPTLIPKPTPTPTPTPTPRPMPKIEQAMAKWVMIGPDNSKTAYFQVGDDATSLFEMSVGQERKAENGNIELKVRLIKVDDENLKAVFSAQSNERDADWSQRHVLEMKF